MVAHNLNPSTQNMDRTQAELCEFEDSVVCIVSFRLARAIQWDPVSVSKRKLKK